MTVTIERLRVVPLFQALSTRDLERVLEIGKEVVHDPGQLVVEQEHAGIGFHLILGGAAAVSVGERSVGEVGPGAYFGEMSIIDGGPRSATVIAATELTTFSIPGWNFQELMDRHPSVVKALLVELCGRIRRMDETRS